MKSTSKLHPTQAALLILAITISAFLPPGAVAQEVDDTIRVNTRVVFMDALVKYKRTYGT